MKAPKRILVAVSDPARIPSALMRKAATIAKAAGAAVEFYHAIGVPVSFESIRGASRKRVVPRTTEEILTALTATLYRRAHAKWPRGLRMKATVEHDYPPHEAIARRALAVGADLVIAGVQPPVRGGRMYLRNTDWELIRTCPCPLLLIKSNRAYSSPVMLAALDPFHARAKPAALEQQILDVGTRYAQLLKASLHAFHAYLPMVVTTSMALTPPFPVWTDPETERVYAQRISAELTALAGKAAIPPERVHSSMGSTHMELVAVSRSLRASIVVMGAVSRSGWRRLFIGSTAERVLDDIPADVLIVKPPGARTSAPRRVRR